MADSVVEAAADLTAEPAPESKIYIHETVDIIGQYRADYMQHMTTGWDPAARADRGMQCFGVWGTVGSTEHWPQVVNMWELDGWAGLAHNFGHELSHDGLQDPDLAKWWATAKSFRSGGYDRILLPAEGSPAIDELCTALPESVCHIHELVSVRRGTASDYLHRVRDEWAAELAVTGLTPVGAFRTAMVDDAEALLLWSVPSWPAWADAEAFLDSSDPARRWRDRTADLVVGSRRKLLVSAPASPLRTGRQP